jgi:hypothetical protein
MRSLPGIRTYFLQTHQVGLERARPSVCCLIMELYRVCSVAECKTCRAAGVIAGLWMMMISLRLAEPKVRCLLVLACPCTRADAAGRFKTASLSAPAR